MSSKEYPAPTNDSARYLEKAMDKDVYTFSAHAIRALQIDFAERVFLKMRLRSEKDDFGAEVPFSQILEVVTPLALLVHGRQDEGGSYRIFSRAERDRIDSLYASGGTGAVLDFLEHLAPPLTGKAHWAVEHSEEDVILKESGITVFEVVAPEDSKHFSQIKAGDRYVVIDIAPPYTSRRLASKAVERQSEDDFMFTLLDIMRRVAQDVQTRNVKGVLVDSWILDTFPKENSFGFELRDLFSSDAEEYRYEPGWQQLLDKDGFLHEGRWEQAIENGKLPYKTKIGFMPKDVLLKRYVPGNSL